MRNIYDFETIYLAGSNDDVWGGAFLPLGWPKAFGEILTHAADGRDLWKSLVEEGADLVNVIDTVALGVGYKPPSIRRKQVSTLPSDLYKLCRKMNRTLTRMAADVNGIKDRHGLMISPTVDWPDAMEKFENRLRLSVSEVTLLEAFYKKASHRSRHPDNTEEFQASVISLRREYKLNDTKIAVLLSAGYAVQSRNGQSKRSIITPEEIRDSMKSINILTDLAKLP